jgi:ABC-type transport system involved in cytochrome bd biosynthesis fused ATPase/permease subunit
MRILSLLLLLSGWFLVLAAIAWLRPGFLAVFAIAGVMVELLGLGLLARSYTPLRGQERQF